MPVIAVSAQDSPIALEVGGLLKPGRYTFTIWAWMQARLPANIPLYSGQIPLPTITIKVTYPAEFSQRAEPRPNSPRKQTRAAGSPSRPRRAVRVYASSHYGASMHGVPPCILCRTAFRSLQLFSWSAFPADRLLPGRAPLSGIAILNFQRLERVGCKTGWSQFLPPSHPRG